MFQAKFWPEYPLKLCIPAIASINVKKAEKTKSLSARFKKKFKQNNFFSANTTKKSQNMSNSKCSSQIALNKSESQQFHIKNANLATPGTTLGCWCATISNEKSSYDPMIFCVCVYLSVLFANYCITGERPTSSSNHFSTQTFVVEL